MYKTSASILLTISLFTTSAALAQSGSFATAPSASPLNVASGLNVNVPVPTALPRMAPELALQVYSQRAAAQMENLTGYSDTTIVEAELPDSSQRGEYELIRSYTAPKNLSFATVKFTGDNFVKTNIIVRLLQQEVDHVGKDDPSATAISDRNYKFNYKGMEEVDGNLCHTFQLKPRKKAAGLFKGKIYLDAYSGSLRRAEGTVKSPSFFVKNIDFVQDFVDVAGYTFPARLRSTAKARIIGRAVVSVLHRGYKLEANPIATPEHAVVQVGAQH